ncbi:FAD-dependent oxidoreductase [Acrocarpospora macrocephala]|uniref:FAD-binding domain-containing protein n=1 Tax=Acrocarpospora macrocephala TaxID=150177 RepID=A0A5M3WGW5_9ACTN|nr:FAD-dependent monooxygenase [Acrocarpospora macrocephala]GES08385.1 hypothetical protein Amac_019810 [Acrocarpospora macrocephala]
MTGRSALVSGAGIAGLAAAIALGEIGWDVTVIEIKTENTTVGVGLNHPANALRALQALGVYDQVVERGYVYRGIKRYTQAGDLIATFEPANPDDVPFQISMTRADLHEILTDRAVEVGARIELGQTWTAIEQNDAAVTATLADGSTRTYDLVIGAEGIRSPLRRVLFGNAYEPRGTGYVCWRMPVRRPADVTHSLYYNGEQVKATVINLNAESMYLLVVQQAPPAAALDRTQLAGELSGLLAGFPGIISDIRASITPQTDIHRGPLEVVELPTTWNDGRVVLVGDAAHAVIPHLAQGAGMAMEDAIVLADELRRHEDDVPKALAAFMRRRLPRVRYVQEEAHAILLNEMEADAAKKAIFAAGLGARQERITRRLAEPA